MNNPEDILLTFFKRMHDWEVESFKMVEEKGILNVRDTVREKLTKIYDEFLSKPGGKYGRLSGPSVGFPPEYDESLEKILNTDNSNPKKIVINTLWQDPVIKDFQQEQRYTLSLKNNEWKISKKEIFSSFDEKWENRVF